MKFRNLLIASGAIFLFFSLSVNAQSNTYTKETPVDKGIRRTKIMTCELGLTSDEVVKVQTVNVKYAKIIDSVVNNVKDYSAKKRIMTKLDKKMDSELRDAMNDEHYVYYVKLEEHDPAAMKATQPCRDGQQPW